MTDAEYERLCRAMTAVVEENWRLRAALHTLLLNYGAALPKDKKDPRSIQKARAALGLSEQNGEDAQRSDK